MMNNLRIINKHIRDLNIIFYEKGHRYSILTDLSSTYTSVTTFIHKQFPKFNENKIINSILNSRNFKEGHKYWGLNTQQIKDLWETNRIKQATLGTNLHHKIEEFYDVNIELIKLFNLTELSVKPINNDFYNYYLNTLSLHKDEEQDHQEQKEDHQEQKEWNYFLNFINDHKNLKPYRSEWMIYDDIHKIAGSVDMVYENEDTTLSIYDWKRCASITKINNYNEYSLNPLISHLHHTNFWHYSLQLNIYKYILENNYDKKVTSLYLVRLHPDDEENNYELIEVPDLQNEVRLLMNEILENK